MLGNTPSTDHNSDDPGSAAALGAAEGGLSGASVGVPLGPYGIVAGAIIGTALGVFGGIQAANAQADAERQDAKNKRKMAEETLARSEFNKEGIIRQGLMEAGNNTSRYAASGVDIGGGSPLSALESQYAEIKRRVYVEGQEGKFKADQYLLGAASMDSAAQSTQNAGVISGISTLLTEGTKIYRATQGGAGGGTD